MNVFLNLRYRIKYIRRFIKYAKILGLRVNCKLLRACHKGANPKIFCDSTEEYKFNLLIAGYLDIALSKIRQQKRYVLSEYDLKVLAINYQLLCETGLNILKYLPKQSYLSKRKLNEFLYLLKDTEK